MASLAERFESQVDRSGERHRGLGAVNADRGTGRLKVTGRQVTAHRVAWELAHGPLAAGARVLACEDEPARVRLEHLRLEGAPVPAPPKPRAREGRSSLRRLGPGAWKLTVTGVHADGTNHRLYRTVRFGEMRRAGLSRSRMNQGRSLCSPFFREDMTTRNPMLGFELPTSIHVSREIFPPEVEEVALLLSTAFEVVPRGRREDRHSARRRSVPVQPRAGLNVGDDPDHLTSRVAVLKSHLGIEDKKPTTIAAEEKALRLYRREPQPRPSTAVPTARKIG